MGQTEKMIHLKLDAIQKVLSRDIRWFYVCFAAVLFRDTIFATFQLQDVFMLEIYEYSSLTTTLDVTISKFDLLLIYLNKVEARDKICRVIQYASKFLSNGSPGTARNIERSTSLARKFFRLFKYYSTFGTSSNYSCIALGFQFRIFLRALFSTPVRGTPLPLVLLSKSRNALLSFYLFLDQIVWAGRMQIYKNEERTEIIRKIELYCWLASSSCTILSQIIELMRLSISMRKLEKDLRDAGKRQNEQYHEKLKKYNGRVLTLCKSSLDVSVAAGLLRLVPTHVTPRVIGALGLTSSIIACYQLFPSRSKAKSS